MAFGVFAEVVLIFDCRGIVKVEGSSETDDVLDFPKHVKGFFSFLVQDQRVNQSQMTRRTLQNNHVSVDFVVVMKQGHTMKDACIVAKSLHGFGGKAQGFLFVKGAFHGTCILQIRRYFILDCIVS